MRRYASAVVIAGIVLAALPAHAGDVNKVVGGPGAQYRPSATHTHVAWTNWDGHENWVFVQSLTGGTPRRVNSRTSWAWLGSFKAGTDRIVYQQVENGRSALWMYDVSSKHRTRLGGEIDSRHWEYWPVASGQWILFLRDYRRRDTGRFIRTALLLADAQSGNVRPLIRDVGNRAVFPGFAGTDLVAWTACKRTACNVWTYEPSTDTTHKLPLPDGKAQYAPAIDESAGTIFFARSGVRCGRSVSLRRASLADPSMSSAIASTESGVDVDWNTSLAQQAGTPTQHDLYFATFKCRTGLGDVFAVRDVDAATATLAERSLGGRTSGVDGAVPDGSLRSVARALSAAA